MTDPAQDNGWRRRPLSMIDAVKQVFRKAFVFSGRARRAEFWKFTLFYVIVSIALAVIWSSIFGPEVVTQQVTSANGEITEHVSYSYTGGWLGNIFDLITLIPHIAVTVRRLHDVNYRGWWLLLPLIILIVTVFGSMIASLGISAFIEAVSSGANIQVLSSFPMMTLIMIFLTFAAFIYLLVLLIRKGTPGANRFGPNPIETTK